MTRSTTALLASIGLAGFASASDAQQASARALRLNPGETEGVASLGLPTGVPWLSSDTLVAVVTDGGIIQARGWGRARVVSSLADGEGQTIVLHVAPTGIYDFSGVFENTLRDGIDVITRSLTGSLTFTPVEGATLVESDCGGDSIMLDDVGGFSLDCGDVALSFHLAANGEILGWGEGTFSVPASQRDICVGYTSQECTTRQRQPTGLQFRYLTGELSTHRRRP